MFDIIYLIETWKKNPSYHISRNWYDSTINFEINNQRKRSTKRSPVSSNSNATYTEYKRNSIPDSRATLFFLHLFRLSRALLSIRKILPTGFSWSFPQKVVQDFSKVIQSNVELQGMWWFKWGFSYACRYVNQVTRELTTPRWKNYNKSFQVGFQRSSCCLHIYSSELRISKKPYLKFISEQEHGEKFFSYFRYLLFKIIKN